MTKLVVEALGSGDESASAMRNNARNKKKLLSSKLREIDERFLFF